MVSKKGKEMRRELKFRAWDKVARQMIYSVWINGNGTIRVSPNGNPEEYHCLEDKRYSDRYIVMQYTGLKDRNKKEIWEGDVGLSSLRPTIGEIMWCEDQAAFRMSCRDGFEKFTCDEALFFEVKSNIFNKVNLSGEYYGL